MFKKLIALFGCVLFVWLGLGLVIASKLTDSPDKPGNSMFLRVPINLHRDTIRRLWKLSTMEEGQKVTWKTLNGYTSGIIVGSCEWGYFVELPNGRQTIVSPNSIIPCKNQ